MIGNFFPIYNPQLAPFDSLKSVADQAFQHWRSIQENQGVPAENIRAVEHQIKLCSPYYTFPLSNDLAINLCSENAQIVEVDSNPESYSMVTELPQLSMICPQITHINIHNLPGLTSEKLVASMAFLNQVTSIEIHGCALKNLCINSSVSQSLTNLDLMGNNLSMELKYNNFYNLDKLEYLDLSNNDGIQINASMFDSQNLASLKKLNLSYCKLNEIPDTIGNLHNTFFNRHDENKKLYINGNDLKTLPEQIFKLTEWEIVYDDNPFSNMNDMNYNVGLVNRLQQHNSNISAPSVPVITSWNAIPWTAPQ